MKITCSSLLSGVMNAKGVTVIIDVFRAFSCSPLLFSLGIEKSILVGTPEEAFELKKIDPELILIGEMDGLPIKGFDFDNSPSQILKQGPSYFRKKTIVQRTSSGVQGVIAALGVADEVLLGSYGLARSTARYVVSRQPKQVSLVAMGWRLKEIAPEDEWCAKYMAHLMGSGAYNHFQALREIIFHESTQKFLRKDGSGFPAEDPILCLQRDIYKFVLRAEPEGDRVIVRKIEPPAGLFPDA